MDPPVPQHPPRPLQHRLPQWQQTRTPMATTAKAAVRMHTIMIISGSAFFGTSVERHGDVGTGARPPHPHDISCLMPQAGENPQKCQGVQSKGHQAPPRWGEGPVPVMEQVMEWGGS